MLVSDCGVHRVLAIVFALFYSRILSCLSSFFFNDTATTEIYTLSLHDALPISSAAASAAGSEPAPTPTRLTTPRPRSDRKSTRLNSSHLGISYAVFCLKKKKKIKKKKIHTQKKHKRDNTQIIRLKKWNAMHHSE